MELLQQRHRVLGGGDMLKAAVHKALELVLQLMDVDVELQEVTVKLVAEEVQQIILLALDCVDDLLQVLDHLIQPIDVGVLLEGAELVDGGEHVNELVEALGEQVCLEEDGLLVKVKLLALGLHSQLLLGSFVVLLVRAHEGDAGLHVGDEHQLVLVPQLVSIPMRVCDLCLALADDLVGDLGKQAGHVLWRGVVSRNGVHHPNV
mmetsp:Transcript_9079/g.24441  ORF Transcript_9079/g.24441 Transcript_9079/m.24441 type:complete len:205 (-) Transcript_9079:1100-1714(-)